MHLKHDRIIQPIFPPVSICPAPPSTPTPAVWGCHRVRGVLQCLGGADWGPSQQRGDPWSRKHRGWSNSADSADCRSAILFVFYSSTSLFFFASVRRWKGGVGRAPHYPSRFFLGLWKPTPPGATVPLSSEGHKGWSNSATGRLFVEWSPLID